MKFKTTISVILMLSSAISFSQEKAKTNCFALKNCKLQYLETNDNQTFIVIKNNKLIEYPNGNKSYIMSDLKWTNECEYNATVTKITVAKTIFKVGDVLNVKFNKIEKDIAYYTANFNGKLLTGKFKIIKL